MTDNGDDAGPFIETAPEGFVALDDGSYVSAKHIVRVFPSPNEGNVVIQTQVGDFEVVGDVFEIVSDTVEALKKGPPEHAGRPDDKPEKPSKR